MKNQSDRNWLTLFVLVLASGLVFWLPEWVRIAIPTSYLRYAGDKMLSDDDVMQLYWIYEFTVLLGSLLGGPLADRYSGKKLMVVSLLATAAGGVVFLFSPSFWQLQIIFGYFGFSTSMLFWSALIKAIRLWGGDTRQGLAFGILAGGGLVCTVLFQSACAIADSLGNMGAEQQGDAPFTSGVLLFMAITVVTAPLVWLFVPEGRGIESSERRASLGHLGAVIANRGVWLLALIVFCAHVGLESIQQMGFYPVAVLEYGFVEYRGLMNILDVVVALVAFSAAILAGWFGGRLGQVYVMRRCFAVLCVCSAAYALALVPSLLVPVAMVAVGAAAYGLKGLYFANFGQAAIPFAQTGTAAGLICAIGYSPKLLLPRIWSYCNYIDSGALGYQLMYGVGAAAAVMGLGATVALGNLSKSPAASSLRSPAL